MRTNDLAGLQRNWDALARDDPLYAVLSSMAGNHDIDEFMSSGRDEVRNIETHAASFGLAVDRVRRALDYGCGVGRVTQAIAEIADEVIGVDIAPTMVETARRLNRFGDRCRYELHERQDLAQFSDATFDLVFCKLVLQHMAPEFARRYIAELVRTLRGGGLFVFQLPSRYIGRAPLPEVAYRARLDVAAAADPVRGGATVTINATLTNASEVVWPTGNQAALALGSYWVDRRGRRLRDGEGRWFLRADLAPGEATATTLAPTAPAVSGRYQLVVDMVQEGICWFGEHGSPPASVPVRVEAPWASSAHAWCSASMARTWRRLGQRVPDRVRRASRRRPRQDRPVMEMHGVARDEVETLLADNGARLLAVEADLAAPEWESFTYWVTKPRSMSEVGDEDSDNTRDGQPPG